MNLRDEMPFTPLQCRRLFDAVLVHDEIHLDSPLPDQVHLEYSTEQLSKCYLISWQLWKEGIDRNALARSVDNIYLHQSFEPDERLVFKHVRANFKHLRCAYTTLDRGHRFPRGFQQLTAMMGNLKDAIDNKQGATARWSAFVLGGLLTRIPFELLTLNVNAFKRATAQSFRAHILQQMDCIRRALANAEITPKEFHESRKIISRQVALYDNLKILYPSNFHFNMSRYVNTINGLMGTMHDKFVIEKIAEPNRYYVNTFEMPDDLRHRLTRLSERFLELGGKGRSGINAHGLQLQAY